MVARITVIKFPTELDFDMFSLVPNISTVTHFQTVCFLYLCSEIGQHSGDEAQMYS
jgi:hypothetical protein